MRWKSLRLLRHVHKFRYKLFELFINYFRKSLLIVSRYSAKWRDIGKTSLGFFLFRSCLTIIWSILSESTIIQEFLHESRLQIIIQFSIEKVFRLRCITTPNCFNRQSQDNIYTFEVMKNSKLKVNEFMSIYNENWRTKHFSRRDTLLTGYSYIYLRGNLTIFLETICHNNIFANKFKWRWCVDKSICLSW
jgi:hypothetical protein